MGCDSQYTAYSQTGENLTKFQRDVITLCELTNDALHCVETHGADSPITCQHSRNAMQSLGVKFTQTQYNKPSDVDKIFAFDMLQATITGKNCFSKAQRRGEIKEAKDCLIQMMESVIKAIDKRPDITCT